MSLESLRESYSHFDIREHVEWEGETEIIGARASVERYVLVFDNIDDAKNVVFNRDTQFTDGDFLVGKTRKNTRYLRIRSEDLQKSTFPNPWDGSVDEGPVEIEAFFHDKSDGHRFLGKIMEEAKFRVSIFLLVDDNEEEYVDITQDVHNLLVQNGHYPCPWCKSNE